MEVGPTQRTEGQSGVGAHDMAGNLWEWVEDCWHTSYVGAPSDGSAWTSDCVGASRVMRGGSSWSDLTDHLCSSYRTLSGPTLHDAFTGVRCARDVPTTP